MESEPEKVKMLNWYQTNKNNSDIPRIALESVYKEIITILESKEKLQLILDMKCDFYLAKYDEYHPMVSLRP